jgi:hypothetical protein
MAKSTVVDISQEEQAQMLAALQRARYGYLLVLHMLPWCTAGRNLTEVAAVLFCSRSSVYRTVCAYRAPNSWPRTTTPTGWSAWPASGGCSNSSNSVRLWCLSTNSIST